MITKDNNYKIMKLFFDNPETSFHIREISRKTGLSSTGVIKIINRLKRESLLTSKKEKMVENVSANLGGRFLILKRAYNLYIILDSKLVEFLRDFYEEPKAIILYGSYAEGSDNSKSDVDIAVLSHKNEVPDLRRFERIVNRKINLIMVDIRLAKREFKNSISNGIVLYGFLEVI